MADLHLLNRQIDTFEIVEYYVKHYPDKMKLFKYKNPFAKKKDGFETGSTSATTPTISDAYAIDKQGRLVNKITGEYTDPLAEKEKTRQKNLQNSLRRSKTQIADMVLCNDFDFFATFTFDKVKIDRTNVDLCKKAFSKWLENVQRNHGKFDYLVVPELHKDGAVHFHCLFNGYTGKLTPATSANTGKPLLRGGRPQYNSPTYRLGFANFDPIGNKDKTSSYIRKYITKDFQDALDGKKRYWHSKGLKTPDITYHTASASNNTLPPSMGDQTKVFENDIFEIHEFPLKREK